MDMTRKAHREAQDAIRRYGDRQKSLLDWQVAEEKLTQLLAFIGQLERTPAGSIEIESRVQRFGGCDRRDGESSAEFYSKLRHWLDRDLPRSKSRPHEVRD